MSGHGAAEAERRLANVVRLGTVAELDEAAALVRVESGGITTDWRPWVTGRAGATRTWSAPRVGEQVVLLCPAGDTGQAVVLPAIYQDAHPAPASTKDVDAVEFPDGSRVEYDSAASVLTVNVGSGQVVVNCATATVQASDSVTVDSPQTTFTGAVTVQGALAWQAGATGVAGAGGGAPLKITGGVEVTGGDVTADGIGLKTHHHTEQGDGAATSAAQA
jgi:phage baseplate assembly protein V